MLDAIHGNLGDVIRKLRRSDRKGFEDVRKEEGNETTPREEGVVLADRYNGKRLNSPNDLVYKSDGALYFTDPPFELPNFLDDPRKELPYSGVFPRVAGWQASSIADYRFEGAQRFSIFTR